MVWGKAIWPLMVAFLATIVLAACGDGEETPTAAPTATPAVSASPSPGVTGTPAASPSPTAAVTPGQALVLDLAVTAPLLTIFAGEPVPPPANQPTGDLRNDIPSLAVGDFNDDGIDDLLIGARFADGPDDSRREVGEAYVIFGWPSLGGTIDLAQGEENLIIFGERGGVGEKPGDQLGYGVAAADVNDDGIDDIIVSAPMSEGIEDPDYRNDRGEAYVIFGRTDLGGSVDIAEGQQDVTIIAAEGFSLMGDSVATGDVNGDGIDDIILGAPFAGRVPGSPHGGPRTELGEVYAVFGSATLDGIISIPEGDQDFTISGPEQYSELGDAVAVGDVNDDGIDDIIAVAESGSPPDGTRDNAGEAYVVFGSKNLGGKVDIAKGEQDLAILGAGANDALGFCVSSGDINDDDIDDIVLVAQRAAGAGRARNTSGEAYVIFGSPDLGGTIDVLSGDQDITIFGADAHDLLSSCSAGHDVNGDGIGDILLGTSFGRGPANDRDGAGEAYVIFGSSTLGAVLDLALNNYEVVLFGAEAGDRLGSAATAGDLNGDGKQEIILVASQTAGPDNSRPGAGEVYVIRALGDGQ
jgi:hypothetical protein